MDTSPDITIQTSGVQQPYSAGGPYQVASVVGTPQNSPTYEMIPHRVFVGGFQAGTTEQELRSFFEQYGDIREVKVIRNTEGSSKGYGFVTFDTEDEASVVRKLTPEKLEFKGRRLNLGPAMRRISHGNRFAEFAVASPQAVYAGGGAFAYPSVIIPEGYTVAQPQPTYLVVPPNTPGYQFMTSPSFAYSPATPNQQRSFVLPQTPNPTPNMPYSVQAPVYGQQTQKTPSPAKTPRSTGIAKTPTRHEAKTPTRHNVMSGSGGGSATGSPATSRRSQVAAALSSPQNNSGNSGTSAVQQTVHQVSSQPNMLTQLGPGGDPMTPVTPGLIPNGQSGFRWPHNATVQQMQTTQLHAAAAGQYYQPTVMSTYQPTADMTHYSQMYPPAQMYQQQDCFTTEIMAAANVEANYERQALKSAFETMKI